MSCAVKIVMIRQYLFKKEITDETILCSGRLLNGRSYRFE